MSRPDLKGEDGREKMEGRRGKGEEGREKNEGGGDGREKIEGRR